MPVTWFIVYVAQKTLCAFLYDIQWKKNSKEANKKHNQQKVETCFTVFPKEKINKI
jgi:hypothetical protein